MKKQQTTNLSKALKNILTSALLVSVLLSASFAKAADKKLEVVSPIEIKYLGVLNEAPLFQVNIDNPQQENVLVNIEDVNGTILYSGKFSEAKFSKKFQFADAEINGMKIKLSLTANNIKKSQVFEINNETKMVTEVVVTKVN